MLIFAGFLAKIARSCREGDLLYRSRPGPQHAKIAAPLPRPAKPLRNRLIAAQSSQPPEENRYRTTGIAVSSAWCIL